jgi:hypothetical protein
VFGVEVVEDPNSDGEICSLRFSDTQETFIEQVKMIQLQKERQTGQYLRMTIEQ